MKKISIDDLFGLYKNINKNEIILDVRTPEEFSEGHVPGSKNISHDLLGNHIAELKKYTQLYLYCRSGGRVDFAQNLLANAGIPNTVGVAGGGMPDWKMNGYPVEK